MTIIKGNLGDLDELISTTAGVTDQERATVTAMVERRMADPERQQVLDMLFAPPRSARTIAPSKVRDGEALPEEAKQQIRALVDQGLTDAAIAEQLGVSRQAVTGCRSRRRGGK